MSHGPDVGQLTFDDPHPLADRDRDLILRAFADAAYEGSGVIDANTVRGYLVDRDGALVVNPRRLSGSFAHLARAGILTPHGWSTNTDRHGGNQGKPTRRWTCDRLALAAYIEETS